MLLPAIQDGDWKTVKGRMRKGRHAAQAWPGLVDVMPHERMLDTAEHPGSS